MTTNPVELKSSADLPFWRQIRWQLIVTFVLVALVPIMIIAVITNSLVRAQAQAQVFDQLQSVADLKRDQITFWLNDSTAVLNGFLSPPVRTQLTTFATTPAAAPTQQEQVNMILSAAVAPSATNAQDAVRFQNLFLYTPDGRVVASSDPNRIGRTVALQPYFAPSLLADHIQPPYYAVGNNKLEMIVTRRLLDGNGQTLALLGGNLDLTILGQIMVRRSGLGASGETYLVSLESQYLLTPSRFAGYPATRAYHSAGIDAGLAGATGSDTYANYRDPPEMVLGVYHWLPDLQAVLLAEITRSEALATVEQSQRISIGVMGGSSVVALLIGLLVAIRITQPLSVLTATTAHIAAGDLEQRAKVERRNEIGLLATGFNTMASRLQSTLQGLEQGIADRTAELQESLVARDQTLAELQATMDSRAALEATIQTLSSPVLPVQDGILVMPLIGGIDSARAVVLTSTLLAAIEEHQARVVILDVTGVPIIDSQVARVLLEAAAAARLLGATPMLVGLRPELAQTIVGLGLDLATLITLANLKTGLHVATQMLGQYQR